MKLLGLFDRIVLGTAANIMDRVAQEKDDDLSALIEERKLYQETGEKPRIGMFRETADCRHNRQYLRDGARVARTLSEKGTL